ncbi:membrane protein PM19L [Mercurialis annua]|uniref:membrane protein PM19L n=1 Tax=Mercurialis annua TaxID=3986 RepID=UPI00215E3FDD|nr:membrane protein PM19L [Mercurialis annua]
MASGATKSAAFLLFIINIALYFIILVIASWAVNHAIHRSYETASLLSIPAHIFPIYFPMGNMATGPLVIFSLISSMVGIVTSLSGLYNMLQLNVPNLHTAAASSVTALSLTLLAMGLACKEINVGWTDANLRTLEVVTIIVSGTQLLCTGAIYGGVQDIHAPSTA